MSRVGVKSISLPEGVALKIEDQAISATGKIGTESTHYDTINTHVDVKEGVVTVKPLSDKKEAMIMWGTQRANIANIVKGVSEGFTINMEINGVGYRANVQGSVLTLALGFSHDVVFDIPEDIKIVCPKPTQLTITGSNKQRVGQIAAKIRGYRPPEPYKGKGVKYAGEQIVRKEAKKK
jgi:large subunit ribosomal protein L6